ncbi:MAG: AbrB/MazE/SpoVT family DNA-binding domain-containing protein [Propionibacteriaceae bacterium]|nr:AbrB/MazE/SpoVT family DNA-binding domain-containing protein [Propionibacteriaceae bacterium]
MMEAKVILSSKGQLVIPKNIRNAIGLLAGSEISLDVTSDNKIELSLICHEITDFFGAGKEHSTRCTTLDEIDNAIAKAVTDNDRN